MDNKAKLAEIRKLNAARQSGTLSEKDFADLADAMRRGPDVYERRKAALGLDVRHHQRTPTAGRRVGEFLLALLIGGTVLLAGAWIFAAFDHGGWILAACAVLFVIGVQVFAPQSREKRPSPAAAIVSAPEPPVEITIPLHLQEDLPPTPVFATGTKPAQVDDDDDALSEWRARLVTSWSGPPRTVEFTYESREGKRRSRTVDVTRISRDPKKDTWYLQGFCHWRQEERAFDTLCIMSKIRDGGRRWEIEDWITKVAGHEAWDF